MTFFKIYTPFIEAPTIRTTTQPVSGGIDISAFENLAQGASIKSKIKRTESLLPHINSGNDDFSIDINGAASSYDKTTPFSEKETLTAEKFIKDPDQFGYPIVVGDHLPIDGAIEPLVIRDVAMRESIEEPVSHRIRGVLEGGNEDSNGGSDRISTLVPYKANNDFVAFEDGIDVIGGIILQGVFSEPSDDKVYPFDDAEPDTRNLTSTAVIDEQLLSMTGSADDDFRDLNSRSATTGFIYSNKEGTDSLAFGGLKR